MQRQAEYDAIKKFFEKYRVETINLTKELERMFESKVSSVKILSFLKNSLGIDIPKNLLPVIESYTKRVWQLGSTIETSAGTVVADVATDKVAIKWFVDMQKFYFGKVFSDMVQPLTEIVKEALQGRITKKSTTVISKMKESLKEKLSATEFDHRLKLTISNATNKARNYSRTLTYERLEVSEIEIIAIIDQKTSKICRVMNGRRISVKTAATFVREVMATNPDETVKKFPWPNAKAFPSGGSTKSILDKISVKLPPYHGGCRTTEIIGLPERVVTQTGNVLSQIKRPKLDKISNSKDRQYARNSLAKTIKKYKGLTTNEVAAKVNAVKFAKWDKSSKPIRPENAKTFLTGHYEKHLKAFKVDAKNVVVKTESDYINVSRRVVKEYDNVYLGNHGDRDRIYFYNKKINVATVVDADTGRIASSFPVDQRSKKRFNEYLELK